MSQTKTLLGSSEVVESSELIQKGCFEPHLCLVFFYMEVTGLSDKTWMRWFTELGAWHWVQGKWYRMSAIEIGGH